MAVDPGRLAARLDQVQSDAERLVSAASTAQSHGEVTGRGVQDGVAHIRVIADRARVVLDDCAENLRSAQSIFEESATVVQEALTDYHSTDRLCQETVSTAKQYVDLWSTRLRDAERRRDEVQRAVEMAEAEIRRCAFGVDQCRQRLNNARARAREERAGAREARAVSEAEADLRQAEADLLHARQEQERLQSLLEEAISRVECCLTAVTRCEAALDVANRLRDMCTTVRGTASEAEDRLTGGIRIVADLHSHHEEMAVRVDEMRAVSEHCEEAMSEVSRHLSRATEDQSEVARAAGQGSRACADRAATLREFDRFV